MSQLSVEQADDMTPRFETAGLILRAGRPSYFRNLVRRNKIANLAQNVELRPCWVDRFLFHPCLVAGPKRQPNTFCSISVGWLWPNSIILAVNVDLDESDVVKVGGNGQAKITLPRNENSAVILDGQHRVAAFRYLDNKTRGTYEILVAFLVGIPFYQQAELFAIINGTQMHRSILPLVPALSQPPS